MLGLLVPASLSAKKKSFDKGLFWEITNDGTLVISGNGAMPDDNFSGKKRPWHSKLKKGLVRNIEIQEGITHIGDYAFYYGKFYNISLPATLKSIGYMAFCGVEIKELSMPSNVEYIGQYAFDGSRLEKVVLSRNLKKISKRAFSFCNLKEITLPENLEYVGEEVFLYNTDLESIIFTGEIKEICPNAFKIYHNKVDERYNGTLYNTPEKVRKNLSYYGVSSSASCSYYQAVKDVHGNIILPAKKGQQVINVYDNGNILCYVVSEGYKWGIMSKNGEWAVLPNYNNIDNIGSSYFRLTSGAASSIVSVDGNNMRTILYSTSNYKHIGKYDNNAKGFPFTRKGCKGYIDTNGNEFAVTRVLPTEEEIKQDGGYSLLSTTYVGNKKMYKVKKGGYYGLTDENGIQIVSPEMDDLESIGGNLLKFKIGSFWGVMNDKGSIIIPTSRGYTSIGRYIASQNIITYTKEGGKGECDASGKQLSFISTAPKAQTGGGQAANSTGGTVTSNQKQPQKHVTMVPVQVWQPCGACNGSGQCSTCFGTGTNMSGNSLCISCHGNRKCHYCAGNGGQNVVQYVEKVEYY